MRSSDKLPMSGGTGCAKDEKSNWFNMEGDIVLGDMDKEKSRVNMRAWKFQITSWVASGAGNPRSLRCPTPVGQGIPAFCSSRGTGQGGGGEAEALLRWKNSLNYSHSLTSWISVNGGANSTSPCNWVGIQCNEAQRVIGVNLSNSRLNGTLEKFNFSVFTELGISVPCCAPPRWGKESPLFALRGTGHGARRDARMLKVDEDNWTAPVGLYGYIAPENGVSGLELLCIPLPLPNRNPSPPLLLLHLPQQPISLQIKTMVSLQPQMPIHRSFRASRRPPHRLIFSVFHLLLHLPQSPTLQIHFPPTILPAFRLLGSLDHHPSSRILRFLLIDDAFLFLFAGTIFLIEYWMMGKGLIVESLVPSSRVYELLAQLALVCSVSCLFLSIKPTAFVAEMGLSLGLVFMGTWVLQAGLLLYSDAFSIKGCRKISVPMHNHGTSNAPPSICGEGSRPLMAEIESEERLLTRSIPELEMD
ncbi:hypothetical protein Syun_030194 [Stephania yunnanensis]|uniref:Leucine-rich repeat-containing N-terminal plant-type domain-containing protein n=1 Tax=Stephania yunnanensis TaxID=152371 RepID=A0AAP0E9D7_9MAGN